MSDGKEEVKPDSIEHEHHEHDHDDDLSSLSDPVPLRPKEI